MLYVFYLYQNNWVAQPRCLRRNIFGELLKSPTSPPRSGPADGLTSDFCTGDFRSGMLLITRIAPTDLGTSLTLMGLIPHRLHYANAIGGGQIPIDHILLTPDYFIQRNILGKQKVSRKKPVNKLIRYI